MNGLVQLVKDEGASSKTKELTTSSNSYQTTPMTSFERRYLVVKRSSEDSTSNEGTVEKNYFGTYPLGFYDNKVFK